MSQRQPRSEQAGAAKRGSRRPRDNDGILPVLAKAVREVETSVQRGRSQPAKFQAIALLVRDERARVNAMLGRSAQRDAQLKRLDGIATILAQTAAREPYLLTLLGDDAEVSDSTRRWKREMQVAGGLEPDPEVASPSAAAVAAVRREGSVAPQSVVRAQLANPFLAPDFSGAEQRRTRERRLAGWELIGPLLNSFEHPEPGASSCMELPEPTTAMRLPAGLELMPHQARLLAAAANGHRTFLLADEPGLGKTAQALLAAQAANAYPLLCVVPNVVKTNWAREVALWTPARTVTVVHGSGETIDGFADIVVVNYDVLDRHVGWMATHGFRGMIVDEAHFIKNEKSQRSQHVREIADLVRQRITRPLMMALTGTPLINDIDDFRPIWQFLGWVGEKSPGPQLLAALEETGFTPADLGFYPAARQAVIDLGVVRRRKVDVADEIPARRIADLPVELDGAAAASIRKAEQELATRLVRRYDSAFAARAERYPDETYAAIDEALVRKVAGWELADAGDSESGENVFAMVRRIGQAKAVLAADYAGQLARSAGKVVFFAKHIDVMDAATELLESRGIRTASVRGNQTSTVRQRNIDSFVNDPDVHVIVCSLTAAGVGINLQVASNVVLAELSWTNAEQTQAIDRVHRIGQTEPVTAWRVIAAQTIDARIAALIDEKAGLAARALDGSDEEVGSSEDIQVQALMTLLTDALSDRQVG